MTDFAKLILEADTSQLRRAKDALSDVSRASAGTAAAVDRSNSRMSASFTRLSQIGIGAAIGAVAGLAAGFVALGYQSIQLADDIYMAAQRIGVGTEELSRLRYAADQSGVSFDQLQTAIGRLSRNMYDASQGVGQGKAAFDALGISVVGADGHLRTSTEVLGDLAERFASMENGAAKTALAMEIFGRAGAGLIPMLNEGRAGLEQLTAEASRFGVVVTEESGAAAEAFNDNLARLRGVVGGLAANIAADLLPELLRFTNWLIENDREIRAFASGTISALNGALWVLSNTSIGMAIRQLMRMYEWWERNADAVRDFERASERAFGFFIGGSSMGGGAASIASGRGTSLRDFRRGGTRPNGWAGSRLVAGIMPPSGGLGGELGDVETAATGAGSRGGDAIRDGIGGALSDAANQANEMQRVMDRLFPEAARLRQFAEEMELMSGNAAARGALMREYANDNTPDIMGQVHAVGAAGEEMQRELRQIVPPIIAANEDIGRSFEDMALMSISALERMAASIKGGGFFDILQAVVGFGMQLGGMGAFGSKIQASIKALPARALGGGVGAGRSYLVGERGPELFTPNQSGYVAANDRGGGGMNVTVTMDASTGALGAFVRNQAGQIVAQAAPSIIDTGGRTGQARVAKSNSRRW